MVLRVVNLSRSFVAGVTVVPVLDRISLSLGTKEIVCLLGTSGCGKTTLLNAIAGVDSAFEGEVERNLRTRRLGYMQQDAPLLPWRTVLSNVEFGLEVLSVQPQRRRERAVAMLELVELSDYSERFPHEISGGMRQRVALARTLAIEPDLTLLDEPLAQLDYRMRERLAARLRQDVSDRGAAALVVTHSLEEAAAISDRCLLLSSRPATVAAVVDFSTVPYCQVAKRFSMLNAEAVRVFPGG